MPVVTDLKPQRRIAQRYNVHLDGKYAFSLSDLDVSRYGLQVGQTLSPEVAQELAGQSVVTKAYALALRYLGVRPRSVQEMREQLGRKEVEPDEAEAVIERLLGAGLLNDAAFAESWIRGRQLLRPRSRRRLEQELAAKGVVRADIEAGMAAAEVGAETELETLVQQMQRKRRLSQYADLERLMDYFARQGYPYDQLKRALARIDE